MKWLHKLAYVLLWVGGINWGLVGLFNYNLVSGLFGAWPMLVQVLYILVGASAVYSLVTHMGYCKECMEMMGKKKRK